MWSVHCKSQDETTALLTTGIIGEYYTLHTEDIPQVQIKQNSLYCTDHVVSVPRKQQQNKLSQKYSSSSHTKYNMSSYSNQSHPILPSHNIATWKIKSWNWYSKVFFAISGTFGLKPHWDCLLSNLVPLLSNTLLLLDASRLLWGHWYYKIPNHNSEPAKA